MIRLIALDIDGTLLDSHGALPQRNVEAIARAAALGVDIVLATGRRYDFARSIFERLPHPLTLILSNGAIVKTRGGETISRHLLSRHAALEVLARAPQHRRSAAVVFDRPREGQVVYEAIDWEHARHRPYFEMNRPFLAEVSPLEDALTEDPIQVMFTGACDAMRSLFDLLRGQVPAAACHATPPVAVVAPPAARNGGYAVALTEYVHRDFSLVDVIREGCSKGAALRAWAAQRGIAAREVLAIGDNLNDLEMLEFAGQPVVMANALPELKTRGWTVTASNDAAGVAEAIETFVLARASQ
jgi:hydroxymethylpyrimidine pyrophosphatase-like HAD family hydrolase